MSANEAHSRRARILVAEDDRTHQCYVENMLEGMGFEATVVPNGQTALDHLTTAHYDLVLLDCNMPVMNGYEAAKHIADMRANGKIADIPVIALTANQRWGDPEKCFEAGMDDYIAKSLWLPKWRPRLERILQKWIATSEAAAKRDTANEDLISQVILEKTKDVVGRKFGVLITIFLSESKGHIDKLKQLAQSKAPAEDAILDAYALTFSCRQTGAIQMAQYAEIVLRHVSFASRRDGTCDAFISEIQDLERAYNQARTSLLESMKK